MIAQVRVELLNDAGGIIWAYGHTEKIVDSGDLEQMSLSSIGTLNTHIDLAKERVGKQAQADIDMLKKANENE